MPRNGEIVELALGTATLASFRNMQDKKEIGKFLREAYFAGLRHIDTAPLYSSLDAELLVGKFLPESLYPDFSISSKFGFNYSRLPYPINRMAMRLQTSSDESNLFRIQNADPLIELDLTLKRLKRSQLDTFYFHGVTKNVKYEMKIDQMIEIKKLGRIRNIGISTNQLLNDIPPSIDKLQIPYSNLNYYADRTDCDIEVHSIIRKQKEDVRNTKEILKDISRCVKVKRVILGTTNISHFSEIAGMINNVE